jgi:glycosyltransferase involved in cell wall biosynthesis
MKISLYTIVRNGIYLDLHVEAMLKHHLPLADEIVVNEGHSSDDTFERITAIDPKVKVFREKWDVGDQPGMLFAQCKNHARVRCTGDWCILMDCDEFIPEWEFDRIRRILARSTKPVLRLKHTQFYGSYKVVHSKPEKVLWPCFKRQIHRNQDNIRVVHDGSNVVVEAGPDEVEDADPYFECHHMGQVRYPARLRQKWRIEHKLKLDSPKQDRTPGIMFDLAPHDWFDRQYLDDLRVYRGRSVQAVRDNPEEFVRDGMKLYEFLVKRDGERERPE